MSAVNRRDGRQFWSRCRQVQQTFATWRANPKVSNVVNFETIKTHIGT
jgi:hypothetical protein